MLFITVRHSERVLLTGRKPSHPFCGLDSRVIRSVLGKDLCLCISPVCSKEQCRHKVYRLCMYVYILYKDMMYLVALCFVVSISVLIYWFELFTDILCGCFTDIEPILQLSLCQLSEPGKHWKAGLYETQIVCILIWRYRTCNNSTQHRGWDISKDRPSTSVFLFTYCPIYSIIQTYTVHMIRVSLCFSNNICFKFISLDHGQYVAI